MKIRISWCLVLIITVGFLLSAQPVSAGGEDAQMGDIKLTPTPDSQGQGGAITLELEIPFYSGCCYPLYAYDVSASLQLPRNVEIVSGPEPQKHNKVEAKAGGDSTLVYIKWEVKSMIAGTYTIDATVTTQNCGTATGSATVTVTEGCVISIPEIYPEQPITDKEIHVNLEALSPIEWINIEDVTLYYLSLEDELTAPESKNDTIYFGKSGSKVGEAISMDPVEDSTFWAVKIPKQGSSSFLHYWVVATDNEGNKTTSPVYILKVEDMAYANLVLNLAIWSPLILTIISIIFMIVIRKHSRKVDVAQEGILVLGSTRISQSEKDKSLVEHHRRKMNLTLYAIFGIMITIGILFLLWALLNDQLYDLINAMGGGN